MVLPLATVPQAPALELARTARWGVLGGAFAGRHDACFSLAQAGQHGESVEHGKRTRAAFPARTARRSMVCGVLSRQQDTGFGVAGRNREALGSGDWARAGHHSLYAPALWREEHGLFTRRQDVGHVQ